MRFAARMDTVDAYRKVSIYRNDRVYMLLVQIK